MKLLELFGRLPAVIMYDLDGTLVDSVPDLAWSIDQMLTQLGMPAAGEDKVRLWVGNGVPVMVKRALADDMDGDQPGRVDEALFEKGYALFREAYSASCGKFSDVYPGVVEFLTAMQAQGVKQAVVTNKSGNFSAQLLEEKGLTQFFFQVIGGDTLPEKKPHPLPLLHVVEQCNVSVEDALMVGDSKNDVIAAKAAGIRVIGLPYGYNHGQPIETAEPDWVVSDLSELI
ncbi:phosphoglycolate phosphatase [Kistimonas scapharcae]|uniref:Phosphoglycolate phosphatase n=1 Tax=Kistimonas scapharcae TaxID=1036133 RepID=A0ABP8V496_9GAMM